MTAHVADGELQYGHYFGSPVKSLPILSRSQDRRAEYLTPPRAVPHRTAWKFGTADSGRSDLQPARAYEHGTGTRQVPDADRHDDDDADGQEDRGGPAPIAPQGNDRQGDEDQRECGPLDEHSAYSAHPQAGAAGAPTIT